MNLDFGVDLDLSVAIEMGVMWVMLFCVEISKMKFFGIGETRPEIGV